MSNRRKLLKIATLGSAAGAAAVWKKPVVDSVSLPAHAQTTNCGGCFPGDTITAVTSVSWTPNSDGVTGLVRVHLGFGCTQEVPGRPGVVANSVGEAESLLACGFGQGAQLVEEITSCPVYICVPLG